MHKNGFCDWIIELITQQVYVLTPDGRSVYSNRAASKYAGLLLRESSLNGVLTNIHHPDERVDNGAQPENKAWIPFETGSRIRRRVGRYRWFLIRLNPLRGENGQMIHWYETRTDIDERKQVEETIRKENIALREEIDKISMFEKIIGTSPPLQAVLRHVSKVARPTVLNTSETATGKELIARAIHKRTQCLDRGFIVCETETLRLTKLSWRWSRFKFGIKATR